MNRPALRIFSFSGVMATILIIFACHLGSDPQPEETFTFPTLRDKIGDADSVLILLNDTTGKTLDVLYNGRINASTSFKGLIAEDYHGGKAVIKIEAWKDGQLIYKTERGYDPEKGGDQERIVYVSPPQKLRDSLRLKPDTLTLALRGPSGRFSVDFIPASAIKPLEWSVLESGVVEVSTNGLLTARTQGFARVVASSEAEPQVSDTAWVKILSAQAVDSIRFERRSGDLFYPGAAESLKVRVYPPLAPPGVAFSVQDTSVVRLSGGFIQGLKEGETQVYAQSQVDPSKRDSLAILVLSPEPVDSVRLKEDTLKLYVRGESLPLTPSLYPVTSNARFIWESKNASVAKVDIDGRVSPISPGQTLVIVRARNDTTRRDQVLILVKRDVPRIQVGGDTIVARGTTLTYSPKVTQDYGQVAMFKWDLDGDDRFEDSSLTPPSSLAYKYGEAKEYVARFYVRDSEGNDTVHTRRVKAVNGRVVQITLPKDGSYTNQGAIVVTWMVDGISQSNTESLSAGINTITRSAQDSAGNVYPHSVTVTLDQTAPQRPSVRGPAVPVNTLVPNWSWTSGDTSGNGIFRILLDNPDLSAAVPTTDTSYSAVSNLSEGPHSLYVQERDEAGNWSPTGSFSLRIDTTAPTPPVVQVIPASPTNNPRPTWSWSGGMGNTYRYYRYKLDNNDFRAGAKDTVGTSFQPVVALSEGVHTLYIQERDSAGNWSAEMSRQVVLDFTSPEPPRFDSTPYSPLNSLKPIWTWRSGVTGVKKFRARLDAIDLTGATEQGDSSFVPIEHLSEGKHILYVQERDSAGNWSEVASRAIYSILRGPLDPLNPLLTSSLQSQVAICFDNSGLGYVAYQNGDISQNTAVVRRFDGQRWATLGDPSEFGRLNSHMALAHSAGQPYLALQDSAGRVSVIRYASNQWQLVGKASFTPGGAGEVALSVNKSGVPYVAFRDEADSAGRTSVMKFNGTSWEYVGTRWISDDFSIYYNLAMTSVGNPIVAYLERNPANSSQCKIIVQRYNIATQTWENNGPSNLHSASNGRFSFLVTKEDSLFIALEVAESAGAGEVHKWNGTAWRTVGNFLFQTVEGGSPVLAIDSTGRKYVAYNRPYPASAMVKVLRGDTWEPLGQSILGGSLENMAISRTGVPWVVVNHVYGTFGQISVWKTAFDP